MDTTPSSPATPASTSSDPRRNAPVQTGSLPGGQPGTGVNTSSSEPGQQNADAAEAQGTEYGKDNLRPR